MNKELARKPNNIERLMQFPQSIMYENLKYILRFELLENGVVLEYRHKSAYSNVLFIQPHQIITDSEFTEAVTKMQSWLEEKGFI